MTLHGIEVSLAVGEWCLREAFEMFRRELPPILEKELYDATVREVAQRLRESTKAPRGRWNQRAVVP